MLKKKVKRKIVKVAKKKNTTPLINIAIGFVVVVFLLFALKLIIVFF